MALPLCKISPLSDYKLKGCKFNFVAVSLPWKRLSKPRDSQGEELVFTVRHALCLVPQARCDLSVLRSNSVNKSIDRSKSVNDFVDKSLLYFPSVG